jgi:hypothetical protein
VKEATTGWKQKIMIKSQTFESEITSVCSDFLCLAARTGGSGSTKVYPQHPSLAIQKFWVLWMPGVLLECERHGEAVASTASSGAKAKCRLSIDPSQSSETTQIRVSEQYSRPVVSVNLSNPPLVEKLMNATFHQCVSDGEEAALTEKSSGSEKKFPQMSLCCTQAEGQTTTCNLTGVAQAP